MTPTIAESKRTLVNWTGLVASAWIAALLGFAYGPTLISIANSWFDPRTDMGHGVAVPLVAGFMIWTKRESISRVPRAPNLWGLLLVLLGALLFTLSSAADWVFATRFSFLISLTGCVLSLWGTRLVRELVYPLSILVLMIPPPTFLQVRVTLPLQMIASRMAEVSLDTLGYSVLRDGNILEMVGERLEVAVACSGIRALSSLFFFCLTYNYLFVSQTTMRWILLVAIVPLAMAGNAARIVATAVVGQYNRALAHGLLHETWGYVTVFVAGGLTVGLHLILRYAMKTGKRTHVG